MKTNVMVIGNRKEELNNEAWNADQNPGSEIVREPVIQKPVYEKVWGNEYIIMSRLEGKLLEDRRLYARALYMQNVECSTLYGALESEPVLLKEPMRFMIIDLSLGGIGIISEQEILTGTILSFRLPLDNITYDIKCEVVYCFENSDKYRAGLRLVNHDKNFIRHLKIFVARLTLQSMYGTGT